MITEQTTDSFGILKYGIVPSLGALFGLLIIIFFIERPFVLRRKARRHAKRQAKKEAREAARNAVREAKKQAKEAIRKARRGE